MAELEGLVRDQPLRERLWAQLHGWRCTAPAGRPMRCWPTSGPGQVLVEELGIDPGAELRRLQAAVLAQDPGLDLPAAAEATPTRELPEALQPVGPPFVGRAAELAWLEAAWTRAAHGQGGAVFLAGALGMGKTRLAAEFARVVHDRGGWVLYGRCTADPHDPLQPFTQALAGWGAAGGDMPGVWQSPVAFSVDMAGLLAGRPDAAVLLVLDDLHLAKPPALEALVDVASATASRRLLVLGAYQDEAAAPTLAELVQRLDPGGATRRRLGPLNQDEVALVLALYGSEQAARATAGAVLERTGGVPLLVHQAAGDWAQAQAAYKLEQGPGRSPAAAATCGWTRPASPMTWSTCGGCASTPSRSPAWQPAKVHPARSWRMGRPRRSAPTRGWPASSPATPSFSSAGNGWSPSWSPTWSARAWSGWSVPRAVASPRWSGPGCSRRSGGRAARQRPLATADPPPRRAPHGRARCA